MSDGKCWTCAIGYADGAELPDGADAPMREAVKRAFRELTGREPDFAFTGWGGELSETELEVVHERVGAEVQA